MILSVFSLAIPGWGSIALIVVAAVFIFGGKSIGKKLGGMVKGTGEGVKEFKKALKADDPKEEEEEAKQ